MSTPISRSRRIAGAITVSALAVGGTLAAGALSPATAVAPIPTGSVTGTVVGPTGAALAGADVQLVGDTDLDGSYDDFDRYMSAGINGDYNFNRLRPGNYKVGFGASGFVTEYYADAASLVTATPIAVAAATVALPAASLAAAAPTTVVDANTEITGVVTDAGTAKPLADAYVSARNAITGAELDWAFTDSAGRYALDGLDATAPVKLRFSRSGNGAQLGYRVVWSGGAKTAATAAPVTVTPGTPVTVSSALTGYAGISGKVLNPAGVAPYSGEVAVYDADTNYVDSASIRPDGTYYLGDLDPGAEYRVVFGGGFDYPGNDEDADPAYYYDVWYQDGNSFASATPLTAGAAGTFTPNIDAKLRDTLVALEKPSIKGAAVIGKTLTADKGRWNRNGNSTFSYEWLRNATVVSTASTYTLTAADGGQPITLRVTNTNLDYDVQKSVTVATAPVVAKYASAVSGKAKKVKKGKKAGSAQVTISVKTGGQATAKTTGTVKVTEGKKKVATVKIKKGKGTFLVSKPGKHRYTLTYSGNASTLADTGKVTVTVKKSKKK